MKFTVPGLRSGWFYALLTAFIFMAGEAHAQMVAVPPSPPGAEAFLARRNWFWAGEQVMTLMVPALILFSGLGARLRTLATSFARGNAYGTVTLTAILFLIISVVLGLPYEYWRGYASLGEMAPSLTGWAMQQGMGLLLRCAAAILFVWIPYALIRRSPRRWWLQAAAIAIPVTFVTLIALPVWIDPITTSYRPLSDKALYAEIETLATRCGVANIPVFVGGHDTTVVGLGPTNRIILGEDWFPNDAPEALRFTVGHELKHYVMGDNYWSIAVICGVLLLGFFMVHLLGRALISRFRVRFGFNDLADPASLPLGVLILTASWLCVLPLFNWYGRHVEFEADRFGLELTHDNYGLAQMEAGYINGGDVADWGPFFRIFRATHPTNGERIRFANSYRPWERGEPLVYGEVCKPAGEVPR
jgi:Zn-dependent protease with chaperone function